MNKQRKVLITITYNEMGIIIDTKAEEVAQPNLQPTCNQLATDCISRQAAISIPLTPKGLRKYQTCNLDDAYNEGWGDYQACVSQLPSAQLEQRWIPVSERLPEDEYVLISKMPTKISGSKWSVAIAIRTADPRSRKIQWRDSGFGVIQDDKVLAWMPLPKPYKEGGE